MTWLAPAWLAAALAVVIPIVLHLRNDDPPDVIQVGSVADLSGTVASRDRRRLDDLPLLLLRCAIIVLGAIMLAGPQLDTRSGSGRRVAVVPAGMSSIADSFRSTGVTVADLAPSPHPWSLAAWADTALNAADTIVLVVPDNAERYAGVRPRIAHAVEIVPLEGGFEGTRRGAPPQFQRSPLATADAAVPVPRRDAHERLWWLLIGLIAIERIVAFRRHW